MNRITKNNFLQYLIAVAAACLVFGIMQGTKDNYGIMMNRIIEHTGISYAAVSLLLALVRFYMELHSLYLLCWH